MALPPGLRCLTVKQPFASGIMAGAKGVENRGWGGRGCPKELRLPRDASGGMWLVLHAGRTPESDAHYLVERLRRAWPAMPPDRELPHSAILGCVRIASVLPASAGLLAREGQCGTSTAISWTMESISASQS